MEEDVNGPANGHHVVAAAATAAAVADPWVCPNDRQLALRAKLRFGWSPKSNQIDALSASSGSPSRIANGTAARQQHQHHHHHHEPLTQSEHETIVEVIRRAEKLSENEQHRVGKLLDRVRNIQKNVVGGDGVNQCVLCGDRAGLFSSWSSSGRHVTCKDCAKSVCQKCSVDITWNNGRRDAPTYLCKLCSEQRETWKKSGAWFYKVN